MKPTVLTDKPRAAPGSRASAGAMTTHCKQAFSATSGRGCGRAHAHQRSVSLWRLGQRPVLAPAAASDGAAPTNAPIPAGKASAPNSKATAQQQQQQQEQQQQQPKPSNALWGSSAHVHVVGVEEAEELYLSLVQRTNEQHVLMVLYAPWCPHCQSIEQEVDKLASGLANESSLVVVALNADPPAVRYFCTEVLGVTSLPSVVLFPRESRTFYKYKGAARDAQSLLKFLNMVCNQSTDKLWQLSPTSTATAAGASSRGSSGLLLPGRLAGQHQQQQQQAGWLALALAAAAVAVLGKYLVARDRQAKAADFVVAVNPAPEVVESGGVGMPPGGDGGAGAGLGGLARGTRQLGGQIDQVMGRMGGLMLRLAGARVSLGVMEAQVALLNAAAGDQPPPSSSSSSGPSQQQLRGGPPGAGGGGGVALLEAPPSPAATSVAASATAVVAADAPATVVERVVDVVATPAVSTAQETVVAAVEQEQREEAAKAGGGDGDEGVLLLASAAAPGLVVEALEPPAAPAAEPQAHVAAEEAVAAPVVTGTEAETVTVVAELASVVEAAVADATKPAAATAVELPPPAASEAPAAPAPAATQEQQVEQQVDAPAAAAAVAAAPAEDEAELQQHQLLMAMANHVSAESAIRGPLPGQASEALLTGEHLQVADGAISTAELIAMLDKEGGDVDKVVQHLLARNVPLEAVSTPAEASAARPAA